LDNQVTNFFFRDNLIRKLKYAVFGNTSSEGSTRRSMKFELKGGTPAAIGSTPTAMGLPASVLCRNAAQIWHDRSDFLPRSSAASTFSRAFCNLLSHSPAAARLHPLAR
jgi:hypothetical protein